MNKEREKEMKDSILDGIINQQEISREKNKDLKRDRVFKEGEKRDVIAKIILERLESKENVD